MYNTIENVTLLNNNNNINNCVLDDTIVTIIFRVLYIGLNKLE